jgi:hypothetical protein
MNGRICRPGVEISFDLLGGGRYRVGNEPQVCLSNKFFSRVQPVTGSVRFTAAAGTQDYPA